MREASPAAAETRLNRLLNLILETAVDVLGFDAASVSSRHDEEGYATVAATDRRLVTLDDAQYESRAGPCLTVLDSPGPIHLLDATQADERWEHFARTAAQLGVTSTLSLHVPTDVEHVAASLNFYARRQLDLGDQELRAAQGYAEQLAATMQGVAAYKSVAKLASELAEAMRSRAVIEQAKGILMAEEKIDADQAFEKLRRLSQHANVKLRDVSRRLVEERSGRPGPG